MSTPRENGYHNPRARFLYNQTPWSGRRPLGFQPLKALTHRLICFLRRLVYIVFWDHVTLQSYTSVQLRMPFHVIYRKSCTLTYKMRTVSHF